MTELKRWVLDHIDRAPNGQTLGYLDALCYNIHEPVKDIREVAQVLTQLIAEGTLEIGSGAKGFVIKRSSKVAEPRPQG